MSTDTTGPITPADLDSNVYLQLIVDAATGHTQGFHVKKKSEEAATILKGIRRLELAFGKLVKIYHSDNAKDQITKVLLKNLESKGTKVTSTSPHSSQQNSIVERRFGTFFAATRTDLESSRLDRKFWSVACLYAIDKSNLIPVQRGNGRANSQNSGIAGEPSSAKHLLPFGQHGFIVDTTPNKKKLEDRALRACYLRAISETQYLVLITDNGTTRLIRSNEFFLEATSNKRVQKEHRQGHENAAAYELIRMNYPFATRLAVLRLDNASFYPSLESKNRLWCEKGDRRPSNKHKDPIHPQALRFRDLQRR